MTDVPRPPHVYVPGKTERHPEEWFDGIKSSVHPGMRPDELRSTQAWAAGLTYFDQGYFWECHEVLEAVWMQTADPSPEREVVQALIQLANARLKLLMDRPKASFRLCEMVVAHLDRIPGEAEVMGLDITRLREAARDTRNHANDAL